MYAILELKVDQCESYLAWMNTNIHWSTICLFSWNSVDMNDPFLPIHLIVSSLCALWWQMQSVIPHCTYSEHFGRLLTLVVSSNNHHFIVSANGHGSHVMLVSQLFGQRSTHELSTNARRRCKVTLTALSSRGGHTLAKLHHHLWERGRTRVDLHNTTSVDRILSP